MKVILASIAPRAGSGPAQTLLEEYCKRIAAYVRVEPVVLRSEADFHDLLDRQRTRQQPFLVLLDSRGSEFTSEELAQVLGRERDGGRQTGIFAVGGADGWSENTRQRASLVLSMGRMTLPHALARVVLSEQIYRALTILAGHPYHSGH